MAVFWASFSWIEHWLIGWGGVGAVISAVAWGIWFFTPDLLATSKQAVLHVAITATALTLSGTYLSAHYFKQGYNVAISQVAARNKGAMDAVSEAVRKVDACNDDGGTWDTTSGMCNEPK